MVKNSPLDISRLWVLLQLPKLGIQLSREKLNAILHGDQSGTVVNCFFVCVSHLLGISSFMSTHDAPAMVRFQARQAQTAWEATADLSQGDDYGLKVQAAVFITAGHIYVRMPRMAILYTQKSCDFIKAGKL